MGNFRRRLMMQQGGRGKYLTNRDPSVVTTLDIFSLLKPISRYDIIEVETEWISEEYYPLFTTRGLNIINIRVRARGLTYIFIKIFDKNT